MSPPASELSAGSFEISNPVADVLKEAGRIWHNAKDNINCFISIGAGVPDLSSLGSLPRDVAKTVVRKANESQLVAEEFALDNSYLMREGPYFRFNVPRGSRELAMTELPFEVAEPTVSEYLEGPHVRSEVAMASVLLRRQLPVAVLGQHANKRSFHIPL
jgi:hypothetical protein